MSQKYKVYFSNRLVTFSQDSNDLNSADRGIEIIRSCGKTDIMLIESAIARGARHVIIYCEQIEQSWKAFREQFEFVQAAGGIVENGEGKVLFIFRLEKWDLPKGKVEEGENLEEGALREVEEECGLHQLELKQRLCTTWHTYIQQGVPVLKATEWFVIRYGGKTEGKPQKEEGITDLRWLAEKDWSIVRKNTYPSVLDVLIEYKSLQPLGKG
jgi:hypothetical protein